MADHTEVHLAAAPDEAGVVTIPAGSSWPLMIVAGLLIVVLVNIAFIVVAVQGADAVVPSYVESER